MFNYALRIWSRTILSGSLLLVTVLLLIDSPADPFGQGLSVFFFAVLLGFVLSLPNLLVYLGCNHLLMKAEVSPTTFRLLSLACLVGSCMVELFLVFGPERAVNGVGLEASKALACYLLPAALLIALSELPEEVQAAPVSAGVSDILDEPMD